jgi:hypothetical protein
MTRVFFTFFIDYAIIQIEILAPRNKYSMSRLPIPGSDDNTWGTILNDFLSQSHAPNGSIKDGSIGESQLAAGVTTKLNAPAPVTSVNGHVGAVALTAADVTAADAVHTHVVADVTGLQANLDALASNSNQLCAALGAKAWTVDPEVATFAATQANTHLGAVYLAKNQIITSLSVPVTVAGAGLTLGILAIYDENYNLVAQTPNLPTAFQSTGWKTVALSTPYTVPASGLYYLASGWLGTTLPTVLNIQHISSLSQGFPGGKPRGVHAAVPTGTSLPNPATATGNYTNHPLIVAI